MDVAAAAGGQVQILGLRFWFFAWYVILLVGTLGLLGAWAWGRRTGWRNRDEVVRCCGTILLSVGMLLLLHGTALSLGIVLVAVATGAFVVAFLQGSRLKRPSLRLVRGEGVARARFS
jgi:hypothetical protein